MRCYVDSSALLKRVVDEHGASDLRATLDMLAATGATLMTSVIARVEVARALRQAAAAERIAADEIADDCAGAFAGVDVVLLKPAVVQEAQTAGGDLLRSPDAIHLATALVVGAEMVIAYDERLLDACREAGMMTAQPGALDATLPPGWEWVGEEPDDDELPG